MALSRAIVTPLSFTQNGDETMLFYTQYFTSPRAESKMRKFLAYSETQDCSLSLNSCSRVSFDEEHDGYSYHIDVQRPGSSVVTRLYSVTFDTKEEAIEEQGEFIHNDIDTVFISDEPETYIRGSHHSYAENEYEPEEELQSELEAEEEGESESENEGDTFMFDLSEMRLKPYGKGYLLIPDKADDVLAGTKYFLGGWWMPNRNAWFFKEHLVQDLMDLGAKKLRKSEKDRTGLRSTKVYWKKLERGYALVPKEDYKHYGRETFRGGKWWKNGNAWFFTDSARDRYIAKYGSSSSSSAKAH